ncbi:unnamed protein product [Linum trigynum]|uniref:Gnk2-homologous domain-containing protein n=1 Tax=Linum trigynum TaxID=586398 RepID=A0AAV2DNG3_9ROSI
MSIVRGLIVVSSLVMMIGVDAFEDDFVYSWNLTNFNPKKETALNNCLNAFKTHLEVDVYAEQIGNRDRVIAYVDGETVGLYARVHCSFDDYTCYQCLHDVLSAINKCCARSYGIDIRDGRCAMRYETYSF